MNQNKNLDLKKAFKAIKNGFSKIEVLGNLFYLKHMSFDDQIEIDLIHEKYYEIAIDRGLPKHDQVLEQLIEEGLWTKAKEREIKQNEDFIENLIKQKKALFLKTEIDRINVDIDNGQKKLNDLKNERASLFSRTAESYAEERLNDFYILKCLYRDALLTELAYTQEEFDELDQKTLFAIIKQYNQVYAVINDKTIQQLVLDDFFGIYMPFAENPKEFFGKPVCDLSYNQIKLLIYARFFKNIFSKNDKMPDEIKKDPDKIMDYINANDNAKKIMERRSNKESSAESIVGATNEDLEYLGIKGKNQKTLSLSDEAKKKGGSLSMDDMMKLFG